MAIVKDYYIGNTHIIVHDDKYAELTEEEISRRKNMVEKNVQDIIKRHYKKRNKNG